LSGLEYIKNQIHHGKSKSKIKFKKSPIVAALGVNPFMPFSIKIPEKSNKWCLLKSIKRNLRTSGRGLEYMNNQEHPCESESEIKLRKSLIMGALQVYDFNPFSTEIPKISRKINCFKSIKRNLSTRERGLEYMNNQVHQEKSKAEVKFKKSSKTS
jgi:hypothetical protein